MYDTSGGTSQSTLLAVDQKTATQVDTSDGLRIVREPKHRRDIDGLRAIAVTLVVLFHAGVPFLPGGFVGVDVFFVISGFLISGLLLREVTETNKISLRNFYARRVRRLIPLATLVLVTTVILSFLLLPASQRQATGADINSAALFFSNWHFAAASADYWADGIDKSPVLHFWSLSVEEQYYLVWPMLLLIFVRRSRRSKSRMSPKARTAILVAVVGVVSLALSILTTSESPAWAYFGLQTRAWELAAGAAVGLLAVSLGKLNRYAARVLMWLGLILIFASAVFITSNTPYPGSAALVPVLGTVMVIAGGCGLAAKEQPRLLTAGFSQYVGRISYSWYLWHWPALVFVAVAVGVSETETQAGSPVGGVPKFIVGATVLGSFVVAAVTSRLIEQPMRRSKFLSARPRRSLIFGAVAIIAVVAISSVALMRAPRSVELAPDRDVIGTATSVGSAVTKPGQKLFLSQDPKSAGADAAPMPPGCNIAVGDPTPKLTDCNMGDPNGAKTVVVAGDSKARFWTAGMAQAAKSKGWKLYAVSMPACTFMQVDWVHPKAAGCAEFREAIAKQIVALPEVDLLLLPRSGDYWDMAKGSTSDSKALWADATTRTLQSLGPVADKTVVVRDIPAAPQNPAKCLSQSWETPEVCSWKRNRPDEQTARAEQVGARAAGVRLRTLDMNSLICPTETCYPVDQNGTITYRDTKHLTAKFSLSLWKGLAERMNALL